MKKGKIQYCYSTNEEDYCGDFDTREDAIKVALEGDSGGISIVYTAENDPKSFTEFLNLDHIWDSMMEVARDECGEVAEDFPVVSKEAEKELLELIEGWVQEYKLEPHFYGVKNVKKHSI